MEEVAYANNPAEQDASAGFVTKIRDLEEKQRLLKDRLILFGNSLIEIREKSYKEIQELKKNLFQLKEEYSRTKEFIQRIAERADESARKEELLIIQRQLDLLRNK